MSSNLSGILASTMSVTRGGIKGKTGKEVVIGTVVVNTERSAYLLSAGMSSDQTLTSMWARL